MITHQYHKIKNFGWRFLEQKFPFLHRLVLRFRLYIKYMISGGVGSVVNLATLAVLVELFHFHYIPATIIAVVLGYGISFFFQKFFTFGNSGLTTVHRQLALYYALAGANLLLNAFLMFVLVDLLGVWYLLSQVFASTVIAVESFFLYRKLVFVRDDVALPPSRTTIVFLLALAALVALFYIPSFVRTRTLAQLQVAHEETAVLPVYGSDSGGFVSLADNLLEYGNLGHAPNEYDTFRTPGYPGLLALWKKIAGSYVFFPLFQMLLVYLAAVWLFLIGRQLFSIGIGVASAFLFVLDPNVLYHTFVLLSETPHVFFVTLAAYFVIVRPKAWISSEFWTGIVLGIATLIKPVSLYLPILFAVYVVARKRDKFQRRGFKKALLPTLVLLLAFTAVMTPWVLRNKQVSGHFGVSSVAAFNLFFYTAPEFISYQEGITPDEARTRLLAKLPPDAQNISTIAHAPLITGIALESIKADPLRFAGFYAVKTIPFFFSSSFDNLFVSYNDVVGETVFSVSTANLTNLLLSGDIHALLAELKLNPVVTGEQIFLGLVVLFALTAVIVHRKNLDVWFLALMILYFAGVTGVVAYARLRLPATPFLFLLAVVGFSASIGALWRLKSRPLREP